MLGKVLVVWAPDFDYSQGPLIGVQWLCWGGARDGCLLGAVLLTVQVILSLFLLTGYQAGH